MASEAGGKFAAGAAVVQHVANHSPSVTSLLRQHLADNDEILPTLFLGEVEEWFEAACRERESNPDVFAEATAVIQALGDSFSNGDAETKNLISVGFVEMLLDLAPEDRDCIEELPDPLRNEFQRMESWSPEE